MLSKLFKLGRRPPPKDEISIIICSVDDERYRQVTANYTKLMGGAPFEFIRISDAKSLAEGYNRGMDQSRGEILIFSHDDIEILTPDLRRRVVSHLQEFDLIGVAGTSRLIDGSWNTAGQPWVHGQAIQPARQGAGYELEIYGRAEERVRADVQALDGMFFATRRPAAQAIRFDAKLFDGFHLYDIDFSYRAYLARMRLAVCNDILIYHASRGNYDETWYHYQQFFLRKFAGTLSRETPGPRVLHALEPVKTLEDAVKVYKFYLSQCGLAETA